MFAAFITLRGALNREENDKWETSVLDFWTYQNDMHKKATRNFFGVNTANNLDGPIE